MSGQVSLGSERCKSLCRGIQCETTLLRPAGHNVKFRPRETKTDGAGRSRTVQQTQCPCAIVAFARQAVFLESPSHRVVGSSSRPKPWIKVTKEGADQPYVLA